MKETGYPIAYTENGKICGFIREGNSVFLGIPYGCCCDGEYRFKAPRPAEKWEGVRNCTKFGPIAMQYKADSSMVPEEMRKVLEEYGNVFTGGISVDQAQDVPGENCLVLNVVTPAADTARRPVMVYIHGGGYVSGGGSVMACICDRLVKEEDIVAVSINHRLNVFGALYLGDFDSGYGDSGILTQLDLLLALQWIRKNISAFGGDPESVTLIGESGGGMKIHHLLAMPESKGLFCRTIIMSGSIPVAAKTPEQGTAETLRVLEALHIEKENWRQLLTMPAETLLAATAGLELVQPYTTPFLPTADGVRMPFNVEGGYRVCPETADIPVIIGSSEEELAANLLNPVLTWEGLRETLIQKEHPLMGTMPGLTEANVDEAIAVFRRCCDDSKAPWQILSQIVSTAHFLGGGAYHAAVARAAYGCRVWHYTTCYDTPIPGAGGLRCAWHTAELPLAFRAVYHSEAEGLSCRIAHAFAAFARNGSPSTEDLEWPAFTMERKETMLFDVESEYAADPYKEIYGLLDGLAKV